MKLPVALSLLLLITALGWTACSDDSKTNWLEQANCAGIDADSNTYGLSVKTVLDVSCALSGCHDAATASSGVNLSTYAGAKAAFESGNALCAINHGDGCLEMPQGGAKLPGATINVLACWAKNGYKQ